MSQKISISKSYIRKLTPLMPSVYSFLLDMILEHFVWISSLPHDRGEGTTGVRHFKEKQQQTSSFRTKKTNE